MGNLSKKLCYSFRAKGGQAKQVAGLQSNLWWGGDETEQASDLVE
jgi:hypothetical protein